MEPRQFDFRDYVFKALCFISFLFIFWNPCKVGIDIIVVSIVEKNELGKGV